MAVRFTQFLRPDGRRQPIEIDGLAPAVESMANELAAAGWRLEIEVLRTGHVHADVCNAEGQLSSLIEENGPKLPGAIETMLREAHALWVKHGRVPAEHFELALVMAEAEELEREK